jgi:hypothetical protein
MVAVDYSLWDLRVWMPRSIRAEGTARAGVISVPIAVEMAYEIEDVVTVEDQVPELVSPARWRSWRRSRPRRGRRQWKVDLGGGRRRGRRVRYLVPEDLHWLRTSPHLPAPIWEDDVQFARPSDLDEMKSVLEDLPGPARVATMATFDWGVQRPDLVRYNRVEGLSVGARGAVRFGVLGGAPLAASLTARLGSADLEPRVTLALTRETLARTLTLSAYHDLQQIEPSARAFGIGNSLNAFLFGRDDGDYYQSTGVGLTWTPPSAQRATYRLRGYAERQDSVARETQASLFHWVGWDDGFRLASPAVRRIRPEGAHALAFVGARPAERRGRPGAPAAGRARRLRLLARVAAGARRAPPPARRRLALVAGGGTTFGESTPQRQFLLGGPFSLRGFAPGVLSGPSVLSGRAELLGPMRRFTAPAPSASPSSRMPAGPAGGTT